MMMTLKTVNSMLSRSRHACKVKCISVLSNAVSGLGDGMKNRRRTVLACLSEHL
jgi:hypothetical protein